MFNVSDISIEALCSIIKSMGHLEMSPTDNELYSIEFVVGRPIPGWGGKHDMPEVEDHFRRWVINQGFKLEKHVGGNYLDNFCLTNWDSENRCFLDEKHEKLPHNVSQINVYLPGRDHEREFGPNALIKDFVKLDKEYQFYKNPRTVRVDMFMKHKKDL